jgi:hypothetical protein
VLGLGKSPVPSIIVAPSKIITPALFFVSTWFDIAVRGGWIVLAKVEGIVGEVNSSNIVIIATDLTESNFVLLDTNTGYLKKPPYFFRIQNSRNDIVFSINYSTVTTFGAYFVVVNS